MFKIALLASHPPSKDPRCEWFARAAPHNLLFELFGVARNNSEVLSQKQKTTLHIVPRKTLTSEKGLVGHLSTTRKPSFGVSELLNCFRLSGESTDALAVVFGVNRDEPRLQHFKSYMRHFVDTAVSLVEYIAPKESFKAIVACDLDTLIAGIILKDWFGCPLIYDAHEYWAHADVQQAEFEQHFWTALEARLLTHVDLAVTVSTPLSKIMSHEYGTTFATLPNAEPIESLCNIKSAQLPESPCTFLFQGGFAQGRGIDLLINAWPSDLNANARLLLRGPNSSEKIRMISLARKRRLLNKTIFFPEPVSEAQLVEAASSASVGVIPYTPAGINYKYCCPNKMSQYMAAGIALFANKTEYVSQIVLESDAGVVVDFANTPALQDAIHNLANNFPQRQNYAYNAKQYFTDKFNWNKLATRFYNSLETLISASPAESLAVTKKQLRWLLRGSLRSELPGTRSPVPFHIKVAGQCALWMWLRVPESVKARTRLDFGRMRSYARSLQQ